LGRVATGTLREHAEVFESEIEPQFKLDRRRASSGFAILAHLSLVAVAVETARGVLVFVPAAWQAAVQLIVYVTVEVLLCMHFVPEILMARTSTRWIKPLVPVLRADLLQIPESEAKHRTVRELARPALFVPETKLGSDLLKEMRRRNQHMAIAIDEHGLVAGVVTVEDLVEEIVGEMGKEDDHVAPDIVRENDGSVELRGSVSVGRLQELFGIEFGDEADQAATTVAGLLNQIAGHVPRTGEQLNYEGLHFEVVEANQRKVLRLRVRPRLLAAPVS
jgi:hypothetical protein